MRVFVTAYTVSRASTQLWLLLIEDELFYYISLDCMEPSPNSEDEGVTYEVSGDRKVPMGKEQS